MNCLGENRPETLSWKMVNGGKKGQPVQTVTALLNAECALSLWEKEKKGRTPEQLIGLDPADSRKSSISETSL